jgi:hypothetical protein
MSDAVQFIRSGNGLRLSYGQAGSNPKVRFADQPPSGPLRREERCHVPRAISSALPNGIKARTQTRCPIPHLPPHLWCRRDCPASLLASRLSKDKSLQPTFRATDRPSGVLRCKHTECPPGIIASVSRLFSFCVMALFLVVLSKSTVFVVRENGVHGRTTAWFRCAREPGG